MFPFGSQTRVASNKHVINCKLKSYTLREPTGRDYYHSIRQNTVPVDGPDYIYVTLQSNLRRWIMNQAKQTENMNVRFRRVDLKLGFAVLYRFVF